VEPTLALEVLLPPACDACDETRGELAELLALQQARTSQQVEHAELDYERSIHRFLDGVGVVIKEDQLGAATQFFECVAKTVSEAVGRGKQKFNRTRPYVLSPELHVLKEVRPDDSSSYPSGHAAWDGRWSFTCGHGTRYARRILQPIQDYGFSRMIAGAHFRSDVYAGLLLGAAMITVFYQNPQFTGALADASVDLRRSLVH
jgi:acid phosphatase (class A)